MFKPVQRIDNRPCYLALYFIRDEDTISTPTYKDSGVDIAAGNALVEAIKPLAKATARPGSQSDLGGFGACFDLAAAGFKDPVLVACTDGVGTKLKVAIDSGIHHSVGIDLVAMCVNDLVVQGATPLFFLDYMATGKLKVDAAKEVIAGIAQGCRLSGCALIGGETAEMPGMYQKDDYDLAGFSVGAAERGDLLTGDGISAGDVILGLSSSGLHSNGFSLVRRVVEDHNLSYGDEAPFEGGTTLGEALLAPTRIYVKSSLAALGTGKVKALAHITGGGLLENLPRTLPDALNAHLDANAWDLPPVFSWLGGACGIAPLEMALTFNCGIGMTAVVAAEDAANVMDVFAQNGEEIQKIGHVVEDRQDAPRVTIDNLDTWRK